MDTRDLAMKMESALRGESASQALGMLGKYGIELSEDELDQVVGGIRLEDGHLHDLLFRKLQDMTLGHDVLSQLERAVAEFVPDGLMGR